MLSLRFKPIFFGLRKQNLRYCQCQSLLRHVITWSMYCSYSFICYRAQNWVNMIMLSQKKWLLVKAQFQTLQFNNLSIMLSFMSWSFTPTYSPRPETLLWGSNLSWMYHIYSSHRNLVSLEVVQKVYLSLMIIQLSVLMSNNGLYSTLNVDL